MLPQPQVRLDTFLQRDHAELGQPVGLGFAEVAVHELLEGLPPPQSERLAQHRRGSLGSAIGNGTPGRGGQLLKPRRVQRPRRNPQQIARLAGDQDLASGAPPTARLQRPPQAHHV